MLKLVIQRSLWDRNANIEGRNSYLRNPDTRKMCCLGFLSKACGFSDNEIDYKSMPQSLCSETPITDTRLTDTPISYLVYDNLAILPSTSIVSDMAGINDRAGIRYIDKEATEAEQEELLTEYFRMIEVDVKFVD